ncbi:DUF4350 domain-containing protein [Hymenobacter weizhouensis]|uniref:DUF4350 domain-containing protein n=1 Tax=Hymenobacter sp. YIM 151500-1 TaxID=2987689 RepID=UPI00222755BA|nr:DUF4350 domain-containing protein [Hymenobacter sp. YIM 151500-1]UYZ63339.1 hypothetical protein OIS53_00490 [Hymenobacter sp. YIM 151500-1]
MTTFRWYMLGLGLLFAAYVAVEYYRPQPLDWTPTLRNDHKIPYGAYVLYDQLPAVLGVPRAEVKTVRAPIYSQIEGVDEDATTEVTEAIVLPDSAAAATEEAPAPDTTAADSLRIVVPTSEAVVSTAAADSATTATAEEDDQDYAAGLRESSFAPATYVFVATSFELSRQDCRSLLRHVARGNEVLIAAESFDSFFADTVGFGTSVYVPPMKVQKKTEQPILTDSVSLQLSNPALARQAAGGGFRLPLLAASSRLQARPNLSSRATQLAADDRGQPVLLRVPHGRGHFYICSVPLAFSNYFVLQPRTSSFAFAALSYLPTGRTVWWDEYQKQGRRGEQSLLRVLLEHEALRYATYLTLAAAALFVLVEARRRQRIIPVLKPLPNTSLLFTRTVASLYHHGTDHTLIAEKKINLFLEHLRTRYHEPGLDLTDEATRERLAQKSGLPRAEVDALSRRIHFVLTARQVSDAELLALNKAINTFRHVAA